MQIRTVMLVLAAVAAGALGGSATLLLAQVPGAPTETSLDVFDEPCVALRAQELIRLGTLGSNEPGATNAFAARTISVGVPFISIPTTFGDQVFPRSQIGIAVNDNYSPSTGKLIDAGVSWLTCGQYANGATRGSCSQVSGEALAVEASQAALARARILSAAENKCVVRIAAASALGQHLATSRSLNGESLAVLQQIRTSALVSDEILKVLREIRDGRPQAQASPVGGLAPVIPGTTQ